MTRKSWSSRVRLAPAFFVAASVALSIGACASEDQSAEAPSVASESATQTGPDDEVTTARLGERVQVGGPTGPFVTPLDIVADSRCPPPDIALAAYRPDKIPTAGLLDWCAHPGWVTLSMRVEEDDVSRDVPIRIGWPKTLPDDGGTLLVWMVKADGTLFEITFTPDR